MADPGTPIPNPGSPDLTTPGEPPPTEPVPGDPPMPAPPPDPVPGDPAGPDLAQYNLALSERLYLDGDVAFERSRERVRQAEVLAARADLPSLAATR